MDSNLITDIFQIILIPLFGALTTFAVKWLNEKSNEIKTKTNSEKLNTYIDMLKKTVSDCVIATNQVYVDSLKKQGKFDAEAQEIAFKETYNTIITILSEDVKTYLSMSLGDLQVYITKLIEVNVSEQKNDK